MCIRDRKTTRHPDSQDTLSYTAPLRTLDTGDYKVWFPHYGEGEVAWRKVYENLSDIPKDALLDHYLNEDYDEILHRQSMGNVAAQLTRVWFL